MSQTKTTKTAAKPALLSQTKFTKAALVVAGLSLAIGGYLAVKLILAAGANLYLSPGRQDVAFNTSFSVEVRVDTGNEEINAVQSNLSYPADKLDFISISNDGSAFGIEAENSGGNGSVKIARAVTPASGQPPRSVSGDLLVATVTFKAKSTASQATVGFADGSYVGRTSDGANILAGTTPGTYTVRAASETPPPSAPPPAPQPPPFPEEDPPPSFEPAPFLEEAPTPGLASESFESSPPDSFSEPTEFVGDPLLDPEAEVPKEFAANSPSNYSRQAVAVILLLLGGGAIAGIALLRQRIRLARATAMPDTTVAYPVNPPTEPVTPPVTLPPSPKSAPDLGGTAVVPPRPTIFYPPGWVEGQGTVAPPPPPAFNNREKDVTL